MSPYPHPTPSPDVISYHILIPQKATTALEEEVYEVLAAEAHIVERPDHFLTAAEEQSLEELNAEEVPSRLYRTRGLLS